MCDAISFQQAERGRKDAIEEMELCNCFELHIIASMKTKQEGFPFGIYTLPPCSQICVLKQYFSGFLDSSSPEVVQWMWRDLSSTHFLVRREIYLKQRKEIPTQQNTMLKGFIDFSSNVPLSGKVEHVVHVKRTKMPLKATLGVKNFKF